MMAKIDVSIILNIHDERTFIHRTLHSLTVAARHSREMGLTIELIMVLDRSAPALAQEISDYQSDAYEEIQVIEVDRGSLGPARNDGIAVARGHYIMTADADDIVSYNMITSMYAKALCAGEKAIILPQYYVYFGCASFVRKFFDLKKITPLVFLQYHPYGSRIFADRLFFSQLNYLDIHVGGRYAYEDWHFNSTAIAMGYDFITAPETVLFYRKRSDSLSSVVRQQSLNLIPPSCLFEPQIYQVVCSPYTALLDGFDEANFSDIFDRSQILHDASSFFKSKLYRDMVLQANQIEPAISVGAYRPNHLDLPRPDAVVTGLIYLDLCRRLGASIFTDVFLMPSIKPGGSEHYLIQVMNAINEIDDHSRILIICHDEIFETDWLSKIPKSVLLISLNQLKISKNVERDLIVLHKLLQNITSNTRIHIQLSSFIMEYFDKGFGASLNDKIVIYYRFCDERVILDENIIICPNKFDFISNNIRYFDIIICDHRKLIELDRLRFGTDPGKWVCLPAYCEMEQISPVSAAIHVTGTGRFLWASRLVSQKFPEILILISSILFHHQPNIIIDIYGGSYGAIDSVDPAIFFGCENLNYCGPYNCFEEIDHSRYDGFIYTTMYDGLPNVVLQAMATGLPVIAPSCDGIPDVVLDGITGFLTPYSADTLQVAQSYCDHIQTLSLDGERRVAMSRQCREFIAQHRSRAEHRRRVSEIFGLSESRGERDS